MPSSCSCTRLPLAAGLMATLALLTGCAATAPPGAALPVLPVPTTWSSVQVSNSAPGATATPLAQWWQRWGDAQMTGLVVQALQAHTSVRSAQAALQQARAQADVQGAALLPGVDASGSVQRSRSGGNTGNSFQVGLDASWEPDVFGRLGAGVSAGQADVRAAQAGLEQAQVVLAAEVAVNYLTLRSVQERLAIARRNLASQREILQITDWRVQAGLSTSLVSEQARAAAEQTAAQIPQLQTSLAQTRHALAVLTGQAPGALDALLDAPQALPPPPDDLALAIPAETLRQRPDVRQAEERISAALARVAQADAARYPSFRISGSLGLRALTLGALSSGASVAHALLGGISVPLFDGGAARAQVRVQEAGLEQARVGYEATVLAALREVEDALVALQGERERLVRLQAAAQAAGNAALLAQNRYESGLIDFQAVLETQRTLLSTQDGVASSAANVGLGHVRLYKALGGGWQ